MKATVFDNARIVDPSRGIDEVGTVVVDKGRIAAAGAAARNQGAPGGAEVVDCRGMALIPGLIDSRVFVGEPGAEHRETIASASAAAAAGGVTSIVMMLRLQRERMAGSFVPSTREYFRYFGLDAEKLKAAADGALVMHPGPMNRGVEISSAVADGPQSVIQEQVEMGVAVRMAVMEALLDPRRNEGREP